MDWTTAARIFADEDAYVAAKARHTERDRAHLEAGGTTYGTEAAAIREKGRLGRIAMAAKRAAAAEVRS